MAIDLGAKLTDERMKNLDVRLQQIYHEAYLKAIDREEKAIAKLANFDADALRKQGLDETSITSKKLAYIRQLERETQIAQNIAEEIANTAELARKIVEGEQLNIYDINYRGAVESIDSQSNRSIDWSLYDKNQLKAILDGDFQPFEKVGAREVYVRSQKDIAKGYVRERAYGRLGDDQVIGRRLQNELTQSIMLGEGIPKIATRIKAVGEMSRRQAVTIARTETIRVANAGRMLGFEQAVKKYGIEMVKKWVSTNDSRTRPDHVEMQGVTAEVEDPFNMPNGDEMMYPLDGSMGAGPENIVSCRCVMVSVLKGYNFSGDSPKQVEKDLTNAPDSGTMDGGGGINIDSKQLGVKMGKHAKDFGLDPSKSDDRQKFANIVNDIVKNRDEIRDGTFRGQGRELPDGNKSIGEVEFYIKGNDVVVVNNNEFVSVLKNGINNPRIIEAKKR